MNTSPHVWGRIIVRSEILRILRDDMRINYRPFIGRVKDLRNWCGWRLNLRDLALHVKAGRPLHCLGKSSYQKFHVTSVKGAATIPESMSDLWPRRPLRHSETPIWGCFMAHYVDAKIFVGVFCSRSCVFVQFWTTCFVVWLISWEHHLTNRNWALASLIPMFENAFCLFFAVYFFQFSLISSQIYEDKEDNTTWLDKKYYLQTKWALKLLP